MHDPPGERQFYDPIFFSNVTDHPPACATRTFINIALKISISKLLFTHTPALAMHTLTTYVINKLSASS